MVGMPRGRSFPLALGIKTLLNGRGLYPRRFNRPMAAHRLSGESHSSRSTPAVRAPWFCVTRRTAYSFADNVRVSIRCKDFTLRQSPSRVAFAIRICILLTFRSTRRQSTAYQLSGTWESADPSFRTDTFMLLSYLGLIIPAEEGASPPAGQIHPAGEQQLNKYGRMRPYVIHLLRTDENARVSPSHKVCQPSCDGRPDGSLPAFAWGNVSTLSGPLQPSIRFFRPPIPAPSTAFLAVRLPAILRRQRYGLTAFPACHTTDVGSAYSPTVQRRRNPTF